MTALALVFVFVVRVRGSSPAPDPDPANSAATGADPGEPDNLPPGEIDAGPEGNYLSGAQIYDRVLDNRFDAYEQEILMESGDRGGNIERSIPACMACHGPSGAGNAAPRYPALRGQHAEYTVLQLKAYRDGSRSTDPQRMMRMIAAKMSDTDMEQVAQYISGLY